MAKHISEECTAIALYGIGSAAKSVANFYRDVLRCFQDLGYLPDKMSVDGPGHNGKWMSFRGASSKLEATGFDGVTNLDVIVSTPNAHIPVNDYLLAASYSALYSFVCIVCRSSIVPLSRATMLPFTRRVIENVTPKYGIGYTRPHRFGPLMYAIGICQGLGPDGYGVGLRGGEKEEADSISHWSDAMAARIWDKGIIRDVYPWNFVTRTHLDRQVGDVSLEQWIRRDARRGTLRSVGETANLWEIEEVNISDIRQALRHADVIFDWRTHL